MRLGTLAPSFRRGSTTPSRVYLGSNLVWESAFNPLSLSPALWLSDTGANPAQWDDQSGNNRHAVQATPASQPAIVLAAQNGRQVRRFDGSNDFMGLVNVGSLFQNSSEAWVFVVVADRNIAGGNAVHAVFAAAPASFLHRVLLSTRDNLNVFAYGGRRLDSDGFRSVTTASTNRFNSLAVRMGWASNAIVGYVNGQQFAINQYSSGAGLSPNTPVEITIGRLATSAGFAPNDIAEILVFPTALSDANRQAVENYLNAKWAIY